MDTIPLDSLGWSLAGIVAPVLVEWFDRSRGEVATFPSQPAIRVLRWIANLAPFCLALLTGGVLLHQVGLQSQTWMAWLMGSVLSLAVILGIRILESRLPIPPPWPDPFQVFLHEPRWLLYRAFGLAWLGDPGIATGVGLLMGLLEWLPYRWVHTAPSFSVGAWRGWLLRVSVSSLIFLLTKNAMLTVASSFLYLFLHAPSEHVNDG
jgi:hypothetical protein